MNIGDKVDYFVNRKLNEIPEKIINAFNDLIESKYSFKYNSAIVDFRDVSSRIEIGLHEEQYLYRIELYYKRLGWVVSVTDRYINKFIYNLEWEFKIPEDVKFNE